MCAGVSTTIVSDPSGQFMTPSECEIIFIFILWNKGQHLTLAEKSARL